MSRDRFVERWCIYFHVLIKQAIILITILCVDSLSRAYTQGKQAMRLFLHSDASRFLLEHCSLPSFYLASLLHMDYTTVQELEVNDHATQRQNENEQNHVTPG